MSRSCKGYLVSCKNSAVKGRLFCFTCAGRKSRTKKSLALEGFERECESLRDKLGELEPQVLHWKQMAAKFRAADENARQQMLGNNTSHSSRNESHVDVAVNECLGEVAEVLTLMAYSFSKPRHEICASIPSVHQLYSRMGHASGTCNNQDNFKETISELAPAAERTQNRV